MVNYLHGQQIQLDDEKALAELEIPDSLHNLIVSRIDPTARRCQDNAQGR